MSAMRNSRIEVDGVAWLQHELVNANLPFHAPSEHVHHFFAFVLEEDELVDLVRERKNEGLERAARRGVGQREVVVAELAPTHHGRALVDDLDALTQVRQELVDALLAQRLQQLLALGRLVDFERRTARIGAAIDAVGAKRVVIDTIEILFGAFSNTAILRSELRRLFAWLKERGVTAVITGERGDGTLTRHGIEEYVSDCVIVLDHRVTEQTSIRRLRILKYRGSLHGTNEYPFLIGSNGISVLPITSLGLQHAAPIERVSTGIPTLDEMLDGAGIFRGSSVLISGTAGTGKSTIAAQFCAAARL